ncbi:DUF5105 domain-containing protein [Furfurilactobacillus entadae]|uniref:DUF5105 domain-containing protein n=1 Tax=Furfurilactobacillus entadae TaxID=2922307 RepID=UPI0035E586DA
MLVLPALILATLLTACSSGSKAGQASQSNGDAVTVQSGTYVKPDQEAAPTKGHGYLALKVKIKNNGQKQTLMDTDMVLRDSKNNKVKTTMVLGDGNEFSTISDEKIAHGDSTTGYIVFNIDKSQKYTLEVTPQTESDKDEPSTKVAIDPKKYSDKTDQPRQALDAYISEVFLNKKNLNYDKLVANNATTDKQQYQSATRKFLEESFDDSTTDEAANKMISEIQDVKSKKSRVKYAVKSVTPTSAEITVTPIVLKLTSLSDVVNDVEDSAQDAADEDDDPDDVDLGAKNAVYEKFPELLAKLPIRQTDDVDIKMTKVDGKWKFDTSDDEFKLLIGDYTGEAY